MMNRKRNSEEYNSDCDVVDRLCSIIEGLDNHDKSFITAIEFRVVIRGLELTGMQRECCNKLLEKHGV